METLGRIRACWKPEPREVLVERAGSALPEESTRQVQVYYFYFVIFLRAFYSDI